VSGRLGAQWRLTEQVPLTITAAGDAMLGIGDGEPLLQTDLSSRRSQPFTVFGGCQLY
jgi:hypothetical protein